VIALLALLAAGPAGKALPPSPIDYGAASMTLEPKENRTLLEGDVWLKRFDLHLTGHKALAEFVDRQAGTKEASLQRFTVDGAVHVERPGPAARRTADGDHAIYEAAAQTLLLTGAPATAVPGVPGLLGPVLREGAEMMVGERILLHLDTDEVEVVRPRLWLKRSLPGLPAEKDATSPAVPMRIEAGTLRLDQQRKVARFRDKVVVKRGELTMRGPRLDARYDEAGQLTTLQLRGGVELIEGDRRAVGQRADYDAGTRKLVLTGDPRLYDRGDVLRGQRIELSLDNNEVKVEEARGRLRPEQHKDEQNLLGSQKPGEQKSGEPKPGGAP
jgi:lipopolysaccharide transport protein LptA